MTKFPPKLILVPMDVSGPSLSALAAAKSIARRCGASLEAVYIQEKRPSFPVFYPDGLIMGFPDQHAIQDSFRKWCAGRLQAAVGDFPSSRVRVRTIWGAPAEKLIDLARGTAADLVVMGTHGRTGLDRLLHGSLAEAVMHRATRPVLAVHEGSKQPSWARILVPCNMSPYADKALAYAMETAHGLGSRVEALYVDEGQEPKAEERFQRHIDGLLGARAKGVGLCVRHGDPRQVIIDQARKGKFDMIILSAHRRPLSSDFVLGSTVERVLRHSPVPVLAVPSVAKVQWKEVQLSIEGVPGNTIRLPARAF